MAITERLLTPIPGPNPSGEDLRYSTVYDKIKEARREDDEAPLGDWEHERKKADYALAAKLCSEALTGQTKDLQIAAWLTEALLHQEGFSGLEQGLSLIQNLISDFWETLYPCIEEGDLEFRATPLDWIGGRLENAIKEVPLTSNGLGWYRYRESRAIGYEDAEASEAKLEARANAIADGKLSGEEFDAALSATPKSFYVQLTSDLDACHAKVQELRTLCEDKFGGDCPSFANLQESIETLQQTTRTLLQRKREQEPDTEAPAEAEQLAPSSAEETISKEPVGAADALGPVAPARRTVANAQPQSADEAKRAIAALAQYLRNEEPGSPVPFLVLRALQWGELWRMGDVSSQELEPPPTEVRRRLKSLAAEGDWAGLLDAAEDAAAGPAGQGWLDLHRYAVQASNELGGSAISSSIIAQLKALLEAFPHLMTTSMADDTPTANAETLAWLKEAVLRDEPETAPSEVPPPIPAVEFEESQRDTGEIVRDSYDLAREAAESGRPQEAIEILTREVAQQTSGRGRFHRKLQLALVCMSVGYESVAYPILQALVNEIEERRLGEWESPDSVVQVFVQAFHCLNTLGIDSDRKQKLYEQICRLDPSQALALSR